MSWSADQPEISRDCTYIAVDSVATDVSIQPSMLPSETLELGEHRAKSATVGLFNRIHLDAPTMAPLSTTITVLAALVRSGEGAKAVSVPTLREQTERTGGPLEALRISTHSASANNFLSRRPSHHGVAPQTSTRTLLSFL